MKILITGDWHRDAHWAVETIKAAHQQGIQHLIHLGDLGAFWPTDYPELPSRENPLGRAYGFTRSVADAVRAAKLRFLFIDGNNDNHEFLARLPRRRGGSADMMGLTYVPRGTRFRLGGRRFGALGGAYSVDRAQRRHHVDWWPEEDVTPDDVRRLGSKPLDVLLAHEVPSGVGLPFPYRLHPDAAAVAHRSREFVQAALDATQPQQMFSGHWHQRLTVDVPGTKTALHVLDKQRRAGNSVVLDTKTLGVEPFIRPAAAGQTAPA
ncbi:metallophosphoesterase [Sinomonas sp. ASV322]|uniref:metallophosphoesterase family protein n=1 Tax=Sinomonas sp. ASV322 TaxID=3041920 RepID=UPI0027DD5C56|nr:metallophosphoesterase [Sinomonas sp. ASV322]MDQ4502407.1 metallophosphoesterase family protein [Sinomonas sp. ASV322]